MNRIRRIRYVSLVVWITLMAQLIAPASLPVGREAYAAMPWTDVPYVVALENNRARVSWNTPPEHSTYGTRFTYEVAFYNKATQERVTEPGAFPEPEDWWGPDYVPAEWTQTGLDPNTVYEVRITATEEHQSQPHGTIKGDMRLMDHFQYYADLQLEYMADDAIKLRWKPSTKVNIEHYYVAINEISEEEDYWWHASGKIPNASSLEYTVSGVVPGKSYALQITSHRILGDIEPLADSLQVTLTAGQEPEEPVEPEPPLQWPAGAAIGISNLAAEGFTLGWPEAEGKPAAYVLVWSRNGGAEVRQQLGAQARSYTFENLQAGDEIVYSLHAVNADGSLESGRLNGRERTPVLSFEYEAAGIYENKALKDGEPLKIKLQTSAGYEAAAVIEVDSWKNDAGDTLAAPAPRELEVALLDSATEPGTYEADWIVPEQEAIERVLSVRAELRKHHAVVSGPYIYGDLPRLHVTGHLDVDLRGDVAGSILFVSPPQMQPMSITVDGPGSYSFPHLFPGEVYIQVVKPGGGSVIPLQRQTVRSHQTATMALDTADFPPVQPLELAVTVKTKAGEPVANASARAFINGGWRYGQTNEEGRVLFRNRLTEGTSVQIELSAVPISSVPPPQPVTHTLYAGLNEVAIELENRNLVEVVGTVRFDSVPAPGIAVDFTQRETLTRGGEAYRQMAATDAQGRYSVWLYDGLEATAGFGKHESNLDRRNKTFQVGSSQTERDFDLNALADASIEVNIREYSGGALRKSYSMDAWTLDETIRHRVTVQPYPAGSAIIRQEVRHPIVVQARMGDQFQICMQLDWHRACQLATIGDRFGGSVTFDFHYNGAEVQVAFDRELAMLPGGSYSIRGQTALYAESFRMNPDEQSRRIDLPEAGRYTLQVYSQKDGVQVNVLSKDFEVREGGKLDLGKLGMSGGSETSLQGYLTLSAKDLMPGEAVTLRLGMSGMLSDRHNSGELRVRLLEGATILPNGVTLNRRTLPDDQWAIAGGELIIPMSTVQRYGFKIIENLQISVQIPENYSSGEAVFAASLQYEANGEQVTEPLAAARASVNHVSFSLPGRVGTRNLTVNGKAPAGSTVYLYYGETELGQAKVPASGVWKQQVTLPASDGGGDQSRRYTLHAIAESQEMMWHSGLRETVYNPSLPHIEQVSLRGHSVYGLQQHSFDPSAGIAVFPFLLEPGMLQIDVTFNDPDAVSNVSVHISPHTIRARRNANGVYTAYMHIQEYSEMMRIGGGVHVSYDPVPLVDEQMQLDTEDGLRKSLPWWLKDAAMPAEGSVAAVEQSREREEYSVDLELPDRVGGGARATTSFYVESNVDYDTTGKSRLKVLDKTLYGAKGSFSLRGGSPFSGRPGGHRNSAAIVKDFLRSDRAKNMGLEAGFSAYVRYEEPDDGGMVRILSAPVQIAKTGANIVVEGVDIGLTLEGSGGFEATLDSIQDRINAIYAGCSSPSAAKHHAAYEQIMENMMVAESAKWVASLSLFVIGAGAPGPGTLIAGMTMVAGQGLGKVIDKEVANEIAAVDRQVTADLECEEDTLTRDRDADKEKGEHSSENAVAYPAWIYDPSGFAYETVPEDRLQGVTATVMHFDEEEGVWIDWDSEWYRQENPQITGADGRYRWDVPPGLWKIRLQKDGYEDAYSGELEVLPPHFDVNLPMVALTGPEVAAVRSEDGGETVRIEFSKYTRADAIGMPEGLVQIKRGAETIGGRLEPEAAVRGVSGLLAKTWIFRPDAVHQVAAGDDLEVTVRAGVLGYNDIATATDRSFGVRVAAADTTPPGDVTGAMAVLQEGKSVVMWRDPAAADLESVLVQWKPAAGHIYEEIRTDAGTGYAKLGSLAAGDDYEVRIVSVDRSGNRSAGVTLRQQVPTEAAQAPDRLAPMPVADARTSAAVNQLAVSWTDPGDADLYGIRLSWRERGAADPMGETGIDPGVQRYTVAGLQAGRTYEIRLIAEDEEGNESAAIVLAAATLSGESSPGTDPGANTGQTPGTGEPPASPDRLSWEEVLANPAGVAVWEGRLRVRADDTALQGSSGAEWSYMDIRTAAEAVWPDVGRYRHAPAAVQITTGGAPGDEEERPMILLFAVDEDQWRSMDKRKLGVYRARPGQPGKWDYIGGQWDAAARQLQVRVEQAGVYAVMTYDPAFADMRAHWADGAVQLLASRHLTDGTAEGAFSPERPVTRAELAALMIRLIDHAAGPAVRAPDLGAITDGGSRQPALEPFTDVDADAWYAETLERAVHDGLLIGSDAELRPNDPATREEAAVMLQRLIVRLGQPDTTLDGVGTASRPEVARTPFADEALISDWSVSAVVQQHELGILNGHPDGRFDPKAAVTRAQTAQMLLNLMEKLNLF